MNQEHNFDKKMSKKTFKKLNQQKKKFLKNDLINIRTNKILSSVIKSVIKKNKKKSKTDKKLTEAVDLSKQEYMSKRVMSSSKNHLDDSRSRSQIFKKQQYCVCDNFHLYKKCYYLFSSLIYED